MRLRLLVVWKSRFGSMPSSSRRSCSTPIAFVIGTQSTTRVSTSRFTHGSASYRSISRASSIVVTGPTRSSPCGAPEKAPRALWIGRQRRAVGDLEHVRQARRARAVASFFDACLLLAARRAPARSTGSPGRGGASPAASARRRPSRTSSTRCGAARGRPRRRQRLASPTHVRRRHKGALRPSRRASSRHAAHAGAGKRWRPAGIGAPTTMARVAPGSADALLQFAEPLMDEGGATIACSQAVRRA